MDSHKLSVKLFIDGAAGLPGDAFVKIFQAWIRDQSLPGHLLIDVADYAHVPGGPGTVLVAHEANVHLDHDENRPGVLYVRKQPVAGAAGLRDRLATAFRAALQAGSKLETDPALDGIRVRTDEAVFRVHDRLLAPNTEATFAAVNPDLQAFLAELYQGDVALEHRHDAERLFEVRIRSTAQATVAELLSRLEAVGV
jgi:hypothetical protein